MSVTLNFNSISDGVGNEIKMYLDKTLCKNFGCAADVINIGNFWAT